MASRHDLEDTFNAMRPHFEDKETEQNWQLREKDTAKLRRITVGNAPKVLKDTYQAGMKSLLEGIIKVINSLDMAKEKIPGIDNMAEIVLPHLVKLCSSTKKIAAAKADATVNIIIAHISYNIFLMKLIWSACDDKNVQPRKYATGWLKTLVGKHRENKAVFEKGEGLPLFEKCLKKGLADSNPDVRKAMRPTYWAFIRLWPERSENVLSALSDQHRKVLITETAETASIPAPAKATTIAAAKAAAPKPKASIKDAIAAKRQAVKSEKAVDAQPVVVPSAPRSLSSAPVRPSRVGRKPTTTARPPPEVSIASKTADAAHIPTTDCPKSASRSNSVSEAVRALTPDLSASASQAKVIAPEATVPNRSRSNSISEAVRVLTPDFSKSISQVEVTAPETTVPSRSRSNSFMEALKAMTPEFLKNAPTISTPNTGSAPRSRANSITEMVKALTPDFSKGTAKPASSPKPADDGPLFTPNKASATSVMSVSKGSEAPTCTSFDRPMRPIFSRKEGLARKALEELPVNEPTARPLSKMKHYESEKIRLTQEKWTHVERFQLANSPPAQRDPIKTLRRRLRARVQRLKGDKYNLQDFRDIQSIIRGSLQVLDDEPELFDELLFTIFDLMESQSYLKFDTHNKGNDHNTLLLITMRVMLRHHTHLFSTYFPRAFCALLAAARQQDDDTHMAVALEDTVREMAERCDAGNLEDSIDGLLDYLESRESDGCFQPVHLGFYAVKQLMRMSDPGRLCRPLEQEQRLGRLAARGLGSSSSELRQVACEFAVQYQQFLEDNDRFWLYVSGVGGDRLRLLTYFLTKQQVVEQLRVDDEMMDRALVGLPV
ncbi:MAG: hypothetical protein Q9201_005539 [Fulgogasparrea decipioides]